MKLKTFNVLNVQSLSSRVQKPYIQANSKTGLLNVNHAAIELIGLQDGDQIQFHQSEDEPSDWFLEKVSDNGFVLRDKEKLGKNILFNSTKIVRMIFDSVAYVGGGGRIYIGEEVKHGKTKLFTLITASLINP